MQLRSVGTLFFQEHLQVTASNFNWRKLDYCSTILGQSRHFQNICANIVIPED